MTDNVRELLLQLDASTELLRKNLSVADKALADYERDTTRRLSATDARFGRFGHGLLGIGRTIDQANGLAGASLRRMEGQVDAVSGRISRSLVAAFSIGTATVVAREFLQYADAFKQIEAQLRLATAETGSYNQAQEDVQRIAATTRSDLAETARLYSTFQRSALELGITQEQAARSTETVTKAFLISGASAAEAAGGLRQFVQGVQSGTLRGEELNSVLENAPRLSRLIAQSLGVTIGELRKLGAEGQISGDKLIRALTDARFTAGIDAEFEQMPVTFDQAMSQIANAATLTFGAFDRGGEFSKALADFVIDGGEGMSDMADAAEDAGAEIRVSFETLTDMFQPLVEAARGAFGEVRIEAANTRDYIATFLGTIDTIRNAPAMLARRIQGNVKEKLGVAIPDRYVVGDQPPSNLRGEWLRNWIANKGRNDARLAARRTTDAAQDAEARNAPARPRPRPTGGSKPSRKGPSAETLARRAEAERQRELRDAQAFADERSQLDQDLIRARRASVSAADVLATFEIQEIDAARERENATYQARVEQKKLSQAQADELIAKRNAVADEQKRAIGVREAERIAREAVELQAADRTNHEDMLRAQSALATTSLQRRDVELRLLDLHYERERLELQAIEASTQSTAAEKEIARRRLAMLGGLQEADRQGVIRQTESESERYRREIPDTAEELNDAIDGIKVDGLRALNDGIVEAIMGAEDLGDVFSRVADQIIADLIRIAVQRAIIAPIADALFGAAGATGAGGVFGGLIKAIGLADGGPVRGPGGPRDDKVLLWGSNGEYMMNARAAAMYEPVLEAMNRGALPRLADGGRIGSRSPVVARVPSVERIATARDGNAGQQAPMRIELHVRKGDTFDADVIQVSAPAAVEVVKIMSPGIQQQAAHLTMQELGRRTL